MKIPENKHLYQVKIGPKTTQKSPFLSVFHVKTLKFLFFHHQTLVLGHCNQFLTRNNNKNFKKVKKGPKMGFGGGIRSAE